MGVLIYFPFPLLATAFVLPGLAWFALIGLAVPAAIAEGLGVRDALRRGLALGRADYVHALGGLATLVILVAVTQVAASLLLQGFADNSARAAAFLAGSSSHRWSSSAQRSSMSIRRRGSGRPGRSARRRDSRHASLLERFDGHLEHVWMRPCTRRIAPAENTIKAASLNDVLGEHAPWCRTAPNALLIPISL